jgi:hypothetical protein
MVHLSSSGKRAKTMANNQKGEFLMFLVWRGIIGTLFPSAYSSGLIIHLLFKQKQL